MQSAIEQTEFALRVRNLSVGYDGVAVQTGLDFDIPSGSIFAILGGSGCGKTTVMQSLIGLLDPLEGEIDVLGHGPPQLGGMLLPVGVSFQGGALFGSMSLLENVSLPISRWTSLPPAAVEALAYARLRLVGLGGYEHHLPSEISGGMQKRAGIARALALEPRLLFLDEPSAGLDPVTSVALDDLLISLRESLGVTTVIVTHELPSIFRIATDCVMLDKGARGVVAQGNPTTLRDESDNPIVQAFFHRRPLD